MIQIPADVAEREPWLQGYVRAGDTSVEDVRRRARRATSGELQRRTRRREAPLQVRQVGEGGMLTTAVEPIKAVADDKDHVSVRPLQRTR